MAGLYLIEELALNAFAVKREVIERDDFCRRSALAEKRRGYAHQNRRGDPKQS